jgi:hypothetical protein
LLVPERGERTTTGPVEDPEIKETVMLWGREVVSLAVLKFRTYD